MTFDEILNKLQAKRKFYGLTFRELSNITGYSWSTHHKLEQRSGRRKYRQLRTLIDWAQALGYRVELVDDNEEEKGQ